LDSVHRAGNPPRRAGNFLLSRQKKVTKEEALSPEHDCSFGALKGLKAIRCALALGLSRLQII